MQMLQVRESKSEMEVRLTYLLLLYIYVEDQFNAIGCTGGLGIHKAIVFKMNALIAMTKS